MSKRFGVLITAVLAFAVFPAAAMAGESDAESDKRAERIAAKQTQVDSFIECLGVQGIAVPPIGVDAVLSERALAHRGRGGFGHRGFGRRGGKANKVARFVLRHSELDRTDQAVRDAVKACRDEQRGALVEGRQGNVDELASCLVGKGHEGVVAMDLSERPRLAARKRYLGRSARVMLRTADVSPRDSDVRADARACIQEVKGATSS